MLHVRHAFHCCTLHNNNVKPPNLGFNDCESFIVIFFLNREDICLQPLLLLFKCANHIKKIPFVSTANEALVGTLMTIGDVNDIFPVQYNTIGHFSLGAQLL